MKIFVLESDKTLQNDIDTCLNNCRLKITIKKAYDKQELFDEAPHLEEYALFVLNLKNPADPRVLDFIRENGGYAPILLLLEPMEEPLMLKTLYYLGYNDVIIKPFYVEEMVFRIYKLCEIWNNDVFFLRNGMYFDCKQGMFITKDEPILLGRKESLLAMNATPNPTGAMIRVSVTSPLDYTQSDLAAATPADLQEVGTEMLKMFRQLEASGGPKIIEMQPVRIERLNNYRVLVMPYIRAGVNGPSPWQVTQYKIPVSNRLIEITLSHRQSDAIVWRPILERVKRSIKF